MSDKNPKGAKIFKKIITFGKFNMRLGSVDEASTS